jgi:outer membrane beta-barrel protein
MRIGPKIAHFDFYLALGAGITFSSFSRGATYSVGAGTKIFLNRWLAVRLDVRDHLSQQELVGENHLVNNVAVTLGISAFFPFKG